MAVAALATVGVVAATPSIVLAQQELDLYAENAWAIDQIGAEAAWETTKGAGVTVAVVDSGMSEHPFFDDKNVERGYSALDPDEEPDGFADINGHGTGIAAAVLFVAPEATILPVRVTGGTDVGFSTGAGQKDFDGIRWAADHDAGVIVIPWGELVEGRNPTPSDDFLEAVQYAIDKDIVVVAAGGNDPEVQDVGNPASFGGVIAVSGTDKNGEAWYGSTTSSDIELAAPADTMTYPKPQVFLSDDSLYFEAAGTSASSGIVGGVAALVRAAHPDLDASNVVQRLITTADDGGAGKTDALGYGLVNAEAAVNSNDVETVTANPLGYPMGEAGASGASPDDAPTSESTADDSATGSSSPSAASAVAGVEPVMIVLIAASVVLVAGAVVVWLVLRSRSREQQSAQPWQ